MSELVGVCLGAAIGAPARYLLDRAVQARHATGMPWGTLLVNVLGCLLLGGLLGARSAPPPPDPTATMLIVGLCGALTTYSAFSLDTVRLLQEGMPSRAGLLVAAHLLAGLGVTALGYACGELL